MKPTQSTPDQHTPRAAITALAERLARTAPTEPLTPQARVAAIAAVTANDGPGAFDQLLTATPTITGPTTCGAYVGALRSLTAATTPDDGTPTNDPAAALHWAAVAIGLAQAREQQGHFLTTDEQAAFSRYQAAARAHGFTDEQIHEHAKTLSGPAVQA
ncbi:hypothetical protein OG252_13220 [Streptomyces sp. NBC_01352]|uniref:hypothetical protein n=1 Tax=Streptomyces sp. NBC_01352 TaxID=2903834 RepID=UPI002E2F6A04|nr:hypothetical protein [Streptomyces sp. NBC_01352]